MKYISTLWLLLGLSVATYAQTVTITDGETGRPIDLATLLSENPKLTATTNAEGQADISAFEGVDKIQVRRLGYETTRWSYSQLAAQNFAISLAPTELNLNEIVISGTKWEQTSGDIPTKIISISPKEVALQNPQTAADLLGVSSEVFIQKSQQGGGSPMIRGFSTNRLLYSIDGVRMNTAIFRGGNLQNVISLDPFAIENTEVLFGPGSVIYGSDAIGGIMSFQTLTPELSVNGEPLVTGNATARYSSANNEKTAHADFNVGWDKWAMVTSVSSNHYGHLRQGSDGPDDYIKDHYVRRIDSTDQVVSQDDPLLQIPSAYSQMNVMQKVRFKPNENWNFEYGFHYSETSPYGRYDRHNRLRDGAPRYGKWNYGPQKWMMNNLTINHRQSEGAYDEMSIRLAQQYFEESRIDRNFNSLAESNQVEEIDAYSANIDFIKNLGNSNKLFYGVEVVRNDVTSIGFERNIETRETSPIATRYPQSDWSSYGAYLSDEFTVSDQFILQAGLRYNQYVINADFDTPYYDFSFENAELNNGALTGNIGATYRPSSSWVFKLNGSTGFRSPNIDDIGKIFDSEVGSVVVPNPDLEAEYAYNAELGIAKVFGNTVKLDVTGYYTSLQNAMVRRDFTLNGMDSIPYRGVLSQVQAIQNAAVASRYGVQAGITIKLPAGFTITSDWNFQDGEDELDDGSTSAPRHAAPLFSISRLKYSHEKLDLQFYALYQAEREHDELAVSEQGKTEIYALDANGETYAPAWYTINIKALYRLTDNFSVSAGIENLSDQRYRPYSSGLSGPGRNFVFSLWAGF